MIIDAFTFFNEKELVELRVKYLDSIVDFFVIVEANITHQGKKKDWNFPKILENNLKEFSSKIQYHQVFIDKDKIKNEESWIIYGVKGDDAWRIENFQRNFIKTACKNFSDEDILIISDMDEIPSKKKLEFILSCDFKKIAPVALEQHLFHLDCSYLKLESWKGSIVTTMQICNAYSPQQLRSSRYRISYLSDSGWSLSSFGGPNKVKEKLESIAHKEFNNDKFKNIGHIMKCQKTGADLFHRKVQKKKIEKNFFPKDLLELMEQDPIFYFGSNS
jgi:beta-1,4-mannosyl-glycoprotein beta-1,4-N-acetylglucosaminyltransferase